MSSGVLRGLPGKDTSRGLGRTIPSLSEKVAMALTLMGRSGQGDTKQCPLEPCRRLASSFVPAQLEAVATAVPYDPEAVTTRKLLSDTSP